MIRIMYQHRNYGKWECIGSYTDRREATADLEKYKRGVLGETGRLKLDDGTDRYFDWDGEE